ARRAASGRLRGARAAGDDAPARLSSRGSVSGRRARAAWRSGGSRWDTEQIAHGRSELDRALALGGRGPYVLQAAIASLHAEVPCDWAEIAPLCGEVGRLSGSPVAGRNR